jgi:hypothetical protein
VERRHRREEEEEEEMGTKNSLGVMLGSSK